MAKPVIINENNGREIRCPTCGVSLCVATKRAYCTARCGINTKERYLKYRDQQKERYLKWKKEDPQKREERRMAWKTGDSLRGLTLITLASAKEIQCERCKVSFCTIKSKRYCSLACANYNVKRYEKHRIQSIKRYKKWKEKNPEKVKESEKKWREQNPLKIAIADIKSVAKRKRNILLPEEIAETKAVIRLLKKEVRKQQGEK